MKSKSTASASPVRTCKECSHAYGWCCPDHEGAPISLRCDVHPEYLKYRVQEACGEFSPSREKPPERVTDERSENKHAEKVAEKVVPLFRKGERKPWKCIKSNDIPSQGIDWQGNPAK